MAQVKSFEERIKEVDDISLLLDSIKTRLQTALDYETAQLDHGIILPNDFRVRIEGMLVNLDVIAGTDIQAALDIMKDELLIWPAKFFKEMMFNPANWTSVAIDVAAKTFTVNQDTAAVIWTTATLPVDSDIIRVTNAEDPRHNGDYTISSAASQVLTVTETILGEDEATDETIVITIIAR